MKRILAGATLALLACAHGPSTTPPTEPIATKEKAMNTSTDPRTAEWEATSIHSGFTAERGLQGVLTLLRENASFADFTPEKVDAAMKEKGSSYEQGKWGFGARISADWAGGYDLDLTPLDPRLTLRFTPRTDLPPGRAIDATHICQLDFDSFKAEMESMGFEERPEWDNPNHLVGYHFKKEGFHMKVHLRAESMARLDHNCITTVSVR
ncbi:hypothetical protein OK348_17350 [Flavobacterium sp. MXW15]|uniref:Lipoprotein n=1 Tax=Xanthomonas chitinilytica TaxID=2989819 RepID=A0ABT3K0I8_9XANT|nr:hypothetical protein [Xanthomonas sp. H13-6]MCW4456547.1 hypothetical protein [Flavobacterium sp. MXW15]MCW4474250.1 hypothetical protein [Xanthomonas sp. H13-6]